MDLREFEKKIDVTFRDQDLLKQAFTHRSYLNETRGALTSGSHNERLEFLGDAVLELITTVFLFKKYPEKNEGELTAYRSALVNTISLANVAETLDVNMYLLLSRGESRDIGRARQFILANTFEAIIGAVYLDQGYGAAEKLVSRFLFPRLEEILSQGLWQDAKSKFQECAQEKTGITPAYKVIEEIGPDHDKEFRVGVLLEDEIIGYGKGKSKQEAEQEAARQALLEKKWD